MDGSIAAVLLDDKEIGKPLPDSKLYELMRDQYGKNYGTIANLKTSASITNGGPVVIENPEMLKNSKNLTVTTNGHDFSRSNSASTNASKQRLHPQGPTDKQIEARTSDGKRRITPIFIPMMENGTSSVGGGPSRFGITEFGSASTQELSKISVEKRADIVKPNVSPNKVGASPEGSQPPHQNCSKSNPVPESTAKTDEKKKEAVASEPKVNILQVISYNNLLIDCKS